MNGEIFREDDWTLIPDDKPGQSITRPAVVAWLGRSGLVRDVEAGQSGIRVKLNPGVPLDQVKDEIRRRSEASHEKLLRKLGKIAINDTDPL